MAISKRKRSFEGKLGNTVIYPLNGQMVERTIGVIKKEPSLLQLANRQKMTLVNELLKPVIQFVALGFKQITYKTLLSPYNMATSLNKLDAIIGSYPNLEIDFSKVILSKGKIPSNDQISVEMTKEGLQFKWNANFMISGMKQGDRVMLVAYCHEKRKAFVEINGAMRKEGIEQLSIARYHEKVLLHTYVTFISSDGKRIANSQYTGSLLW